MCINAPLPAASAAKREAGGFNAAYELQNHVLGSGASGTVLEAICRKSGRVVAVKRCDKQGLEADEVQSLRDEIRIHRALKHPGIVDLHSAYESQTTVSVVMERMQGGDVFERLRDHGCYSEADAAVVALQVLRALAYLHGRRVVHRDLKPENMVYEHRDSNTLKLIDFGIAAQRQPGEKLTERCGTPAYVAPEVVLGSAYDESADMWSVGAVVYALLTGEELCRDERDIVRQMRAGRLNVGRRFKKLSKSAQDFIRSLLAFDPASRPDACQAMHHQWFHLVTPDEAARAQRLVGEDAQSLRGVLGCRAGAVAGQTLKILGYGVLGLSIWGALRNKRRLS